MYSKTIVNPMVLFLGAWGSCFLLFNLHLSEWFIFPANEVTRIVAWICLPFVLAVILFEAVWAVLPKRRIVRHTDIDDAVYLSVVERRLDRWFYCWIVLSLIEAGFCGGLPIIWLLTGSSKVYIEYGLPVIHVFLWALLAVLATGKLGIYLLYGNRRRLLIPALQVLWGVMIISRGLIIGAFIQAAVLWVCLRGISVKTLLRSTLGAVLIVLMFGYMGDMRTGSSVIKEVGRPTNNYPDWLPSGVLWFYIYVTSPLANLVNTSLMSRPTGDVFFSQTVVFMFPRPLRNAFYGSRFIEDQQAVGDLVTPNLTVSSAYIGPYLDYGFVGIGCYSSFLGAIAAYCWKKRRSFRDKLRYALIGQCILFSVFWNFLFYTPTLVQIFWIYLIFARGRFASNIFPRQWRLSATA